MAKKKVVLGLSMADAKQRTKVLNCAAKFPGVTSMSISGDKLTVEGEGIDPVVMTLRLRKKVGRTQIDTVGTIEEKKKKKEEEEKNETKNVSKTNPTAQPDKVPYPVGTHQLVHYYVYENEDPNYGNFCSIL